MDLTETITENGVEIIREYEQVDQANRRLLRELNAETGEVIREFIYANLVTDAAWNELKNIIDNYNG